MVQKFACLILMLTFGLTASADYLPFNHDVLCKSHDGDETEIKIVYDRSEFPENGRKGGIHVELNVGVGEFSAITQLWKVQQPFRRTLRISGPAGNPGNWLVQDTTDPLVAKAKVSFANWELIGDDGAVEQEFRSFIATVTLSKITETAIDENGIKTQDYIQLRVNGGLSGFGSHYARFASTDCKTLN